MEPYKAKKLPFEYNMSSELLRLLCDAKETYGEYKGYLKEITPQTSKPKFQVVEVAYCE